MDRRELRRRVLGYMNTMEIQRDLMEVLASTVDIDGDPIMGQELQRFVTKLTTTLDEMYLWAGGI